MLITSISGIRGTIGGTPHENLTPVDIVGFISAYGTWLQSRYSSPRVVIGRDGRASGNMILGIAVQTLISLGIDVVNLDYATTPTVEMEVIRREASGGLIITASHNPKPYNGIKMLNDKGEFLSLKDGELILNIKNKGDYSFADVDSLGKESKSYNHTKDHIDDILNLDLVDAELVRSKNYTVCVDAINSVGGLAVPMLLKKMGVEVVGLYCEVNGDFQHEPEPLEKNLGELMSLVTKTHADLGIAVDPDVDRLVLVDEKGQIINEEYGIVLAADYVLSQTAGPTVSNLSSSQALEDLTTQYGKEYSASAVGEKNVVEKMKEINAVIGGEGSGGIIYPELHYGRDALVGIALILSFMAKEDTTISTLRDRYQDYFMVKDKLELEDRDSIPGLLDDLAENTDGLVSRVDGLKISFENSWVHIRPSNTEPILRIISEARTETETLSLVDKYKDRILSLM
ncbi:phosphoglucosamine mutase [Candidatus Campbellbacteria bacterium]|nr:phosphoglucosamine mutase [Candidatus Campbellbacteria bacterium]